MAKVLISFDQSVEHFKAMRPVIEKLRTYYNEIDLLCTEALAHSPVLQNTPGITRYIPSLTPVAQLSIHYRERERNNDRHLELLGQKHYDAQYFMPLLDSVEAAEAAYRAYCCTERKTSGSQGRLLVGFHHGIGDFIAFTPTLRFLSQHYQTIDLCCKPDLVQSGFLQYCPYFNDVFPLLDELWVADFFKVMAKNQQRYLDLLAAGAYDQHYFVPNTWTDKKIKLYPIGACLPALGFNADDPTALDLEVWPDLSSHNAAVKHYKRCQPYAFVHNYRPKNQRSFSIDTLPELTAFQGKVFNTRDAQFRDINDAFACLKYAERVVLMDSVFMWAAWALNKPIDYLYYVEAKELGYNDTKCHPISRHRSLVSRCNVNLV